jgi:hypothetical protein
MNRTICEPDLIRFSRSPSQTQPAALIHNPIHSSNPQPIQSDAHNDAHNGICNGVHKRVHNGKYGEHYERA